MLLSAAQASVKATIGTLLSSLQAPRVTAVAFAKEIVSVVFRTRQNRYDFEWKLTTSATTIPSPSAVCKPK
jgi:hypothetical protein